MNSTKININESEQAKLELTWKNINAYVEPKSGIFKKKTKNEITHILKNCRKLFVIIIIYIIFMKKILSTSEWSGQIW
jgi:hypothetical protein